MTDEIQEVEYPKCGVKCRDFTPEADFIGWNGHCVLCSESNKRHFVRPAWMAYAGSRSLDIDKEMPRLLTMFEERYGFVRCDDEAVLPVS